MWPRAVRAGGRQSCNQDIVQLERGALHVCEWIVGDDDGDGGDDDDEVLVVW